jgi:signal transduction histidine kinase
VHIQGEQARPAVTRALRSRGSPTIGLLVGLFITLAAVVADSWYVSSQISGLRTLQRDLADRNRKDSLQLLRAQNDLNSLGLAMRDMLDGDEPYALTAWSAQFGRVRTDLDDALRREEQVAVATRTAEQRRFLSSAVGQFWDAVDRTFALASDGHEEEARDQIRLSLQARQASLSTAVSRLLVENNESEEQTAQRIQDIYIRVQRQVYLFLAATFGAIVVTSLYLIQHNRRLFARLGALSDERREIAQQLIATRESTLRHVARELHDELGQTLTAMGLMLTRAAKHAPESSELRSSLHEVSEVAQAALDSVRSLSQTLHPSILEEVGLDDTVRWYLSTIERQLRIEVSYDRSGTPVRVESDVAIHVYRVLQEAVTNVARHAGTARIAVRLVFEATALRLEVEDHGKGLDARQPRRGLGIVTMRERAELIGGSLEFLRPDEGGTIVRLIVPLTGAANVPQRSVRVG